MFDINGMVDVIFGGGFFQEIAETLNFKSGAYWGLISNTFNNVILPVGYTLLCLYFLLELLAQTTRDNFNMEHFIRLLIKLLIGKLLMDNCIALLDGLTTFSNAIMNSITVNTTGDASRVNADALKRSGLTFWKELALWFKLIIPYLAMVAANLFAKITIYSRAIELIVRTLMAPIGMADIFAEGMRGSGFKYLKKFLAVNLQGAIILAIIVAMNFFNQSLVTEKYFAEEYERLNKSYSGQILEGQLHALNNNKIVLTDPEQIPENIVLTSILTAFVTVILIQRSKEIAGELVGV